MVKLIQEAIKKLVEGVDLTKEEVIGVMREMMEGATTPSQQGAYLTALSCKGETVDEITASAMVMRAYAEPISPKSSPLMDTCGTGGDGQGTFNISTTAAFVVAGGGMKVAKHGNRSVSSKSGSADLLEELGVNIDLTPRQVEESIDRVGMGFLLAPSLHPAMAHVMSTRRELGIRTIFNLLGPLSNPASVQYQIMGVYDRKWVKPLALVLMELGVKGALVFHGANALDELTTTGENHGVMLLEGVMEDFSLLPEELGLKGASLGEIRGGSPRENALITREVLAGKKGAPLDTVLLNAAAAFFIGGKVPSFKGGIDLAKEVVESGKALEILNTLVAFTQGEKPWVS